MIALRFHNTSSCKRLLTSFAIVLINASQLMRGSVLFKKSVNSLSQTIPERWPVSRWLASDVAAIDPSIMPCAPTITAEQAAPILDGVYLWDVWPVQLDDGIVPTVAGGQLWVVMSAPDNGDPDSRHSIARWRLFLVKDNIWQDCGLIFPDGLTPGSREWSGSVRLNPDTNRVTAWLTAAGRRGDVEKSVEQRLFVTQGTLDLSGPHPVVTDWSTPVEAVAPDHEAYIDTALDQGPPGRINGFRDPYWFRDPADGQGYILFTASKPNAGHSHTGLIGIAMANDVDGAGAYTLLPPLIDATGTSNELERAHMFVKDGLYYLFWSTQRTMFADGTGFAEGTGSAPSGLYGMVAQTLFGPYQPLNGTGLVLANPPQEPKQAYCWQILPNGDVYSFVDHWGLNGRSLQDHPELYVSQFGGTIAPILKIEIDGYQTRVKP
jgi:levansucrase